MGNQTFDIVMIRALYGFGHDHDDEDILVYYAKVCDNLTIKHIVYRTIQSINHNCQGSIQQKIALLNTIWL